MSDFPPGSSGPPRSGDLFDPGVPPPGRDPEAIHRRVRAPAIFLLVVNALNVLLGILLLSEAFRVKSNVAAAEAQMEQGWSTLTPQQLDQMNQFGWNPQNLVAFYSNSCLWGGGLSVIVGVVGLLAGIRMLALRSYGIGITGAILTAIPCVSPGCIIGQIAGIWALIVLLNGEVRSAFR